MEELFIKEGKLIPKEKWEATVDILKADGKPSTKEELRDVFLDAVKKRIPNKKFGILFSGGLDSSFIAFLCNKFSKQDFICFTVGLENSPDIKASIKVAAEHDLAHEIKILDQEDILETIKILKPLFKDIPKDENLAVLYGVGIVSYQGLKLAKDSGCELVFAGLGSEEIFAGYKRHQEAEDINEECWKGLKGMWQRDFLRDTIIASHLKIGAATPYLDPAVIQAAMGIAGEEKLKDGFKKHILRVIAEEQGLHKECAWRPKKGAQYGSSTLKAIKKLAKKEGKNMREYLL